MKIKDYYVKAFPTDDLGHKINSEATFEGLFETLERYRDVYKYIGIGDSVIRERIFEKLAEIMDVEYDYVYEQWLFAA